MEEKISKEIFCAVMDLGSQSFLSLIGKHNACDGSIQILETSSHLLQIGSDVRQTGVLSEEKFNQAFESVKEFFLLTKKV